MTLREVQLQAVVADMAGQLRWTSDRLREGMDSEAVADYVDMWRAVIERELSKYEEQATQ